MSAAKAIPDADRRRPATPTTAAASPRAATPTPHRQDVAELLRNSPFPTAEDDAEDDATVLARATERANHLLGKHDAPRDTAYLRTLAWERHRKGVATATSPTSSTSLPAPSDRGSPPSVTTSPPTSPSCARPISYWPSTPSAACSPPPVSSSKSSATPPCPSSNRSPSPPAHVKSATRARPSQAPRYILAPSPSRKSLTAFSPSTPPPSPPRPNAKMRQKRQRPRRSPSPRFRQNRQLPHPPQPTLPQKCHPTHSPTHNRP